MKAFMMSIAAILVITLGAAFVVNDTVGVSADEKFTGSNVRLD